MNMGALLKFVGLVFDAGIVLENELEVERRTFLDKIDRYFYATVSSLLRSNERPYIPFKWIYLYVNGQRQSARGATAVDL